MASDPSATSSKPVPVRLRYVIHSIPASKPLPLPLMLPLLADTAAAEEKDDVPVRVMYSCMIFLISVIAAFAIADGELGRGADFDTDCVSVCHDAATPATEAAVDVDNTVAFDAVDGGGVGGAASVDTSGS